MESYPVNLDITKKQVLVVGGGQVAARKVKRLAAAGAKIKLVSPELNPELAKLTEKEKINYYQRKFTPEDITKQFLVIAATDKTQINQQVGKLARRADKLVNVVDSAELSNFTLPAVVKRGKLLLTAATGGNLPALAKLIRQRLAGEFGPEFAYFLDLLDQLRPVIKNRLKEEQERRKLFRRLADWELIELIECNKAAARTKIVEILSDAGIVVEEEELRVNEGVGDERSYCRN